MPPGETEPRTDVTDAGTLTVMLVDDQAVIRVGLQSMLDNEDGIDVIAVASDGETAVGLFERHRPDVTILDVRMPGVDGIETLRRILNVAPEARVVMLSTAELDDEVATALEIGAAGYLTKTEPVEGYLDVLRRVADGETCFSDRTLQRLADRRRLTPRELEVLRGMARGETNHQIGRSLHLSEHTVKTHAKGVLAKLAADDRAGAVAAGFARGILKVPTVGAEPPDREDATGDAKA